MARFSPEQQAVRAAARAERLAALRQVSIEKYGEELGLPFFNYINGEARTLGEQDTRRVAFAEAILEAFDGPKEKAVQALSAFLEATEINDRRASQRIFNLEASHARF